MSVIADLMVGSAKLAITLVVLEVPLIAEAKAVKSLVDVMDAFTS